MGTDKMSLRFTLNVLKWVCLAMNLHFRTPFHRFVPICITPQNQVIPSKSGYRIDPPTELAPYMWLTVMVVVWLVALVHTKTLVDGYDENL